MLQVLDGTAGLGPPALSGGPHRCSWSQVVATNFPDAGTRSCAAAMPRAADGRSGGVWVIGNSPGSKVCKRGSFLAGLLALSKQGRRCCTDDRFTLTLSVAEDGLTFDRHFVVRDRSSLLPTRHHGSGKNPGFACTSGKVGCHAVRCRLTKRTSCHADPSGVWKGDTMLIAYSESKENISVTRFPIASIMGARA